jgi:hypothetical protein
MYIVEKYIMHLHELQKQTEKQVVGQITTPQVTGLVSIFPAIDTTTSN